MGSPAKKRQSWPAIRRGQRGEISFVQVAIGTHGKLHEGPLGLALKQARELLKDALKKNAEGHGGQLASWEDDRGTFMFLIDDPDGFDHCCSAAIEMLERLPSIRRKLRLSTELERLLTIRLSCDTGTVAFDETAQAFVVDAADAFAKHSQAVSEENNVVVTERVFCQLKNPLKSWFERWKYSTELNVNLYRASDTRAKLAVSRPDSTPDMALPVLDEELSPANPVPASRAEHPSAREWLPPVSRALKSRKALSAAAAVLLLLVIGGLARYFVWPPAPTAVPPPDVVSPPTPTAGPAPETLPWGELFQKPEWREWRKQIHEKLSAGEVREKTLAGALRIKLPARSEHASEALRRDQAIAEVLMSYPSVKKLLRDRLGIDERGFLGTGLSKPLKAADYGAASVHEYLIENHYSDYTAIRMWILDPYTDDMKMTIHELVEKDPGADPQKKSLLEKIAQRVKEKDTNIPAVVRFAILDREEYSRRLGRPERCRVFASNMAELWATTVQDAANFSGYTYTKGEKVYVWAFLPNHPDEVVLATWGELFNHLSEWLSKSKPAEGLTEP